MWKLWKTGLNFLKPAVESPQPLRSITFVLERVHPTRLTRPGRFPSLRRKHFIYKVLQTNEPVQWNMDVLLRKYVEDLGQPGEVVNLQAHKARMLLLTKMAVYASEENIKKYGKMSGEEITYSSRFALTTIGMFSRLLLDIPMNKEQTWTLQPWHIRSALRIHQVSVPENSIIMPKLPISGPDMALNNKQFYVHIIINGREKVPLLCRIQHWATNPKERRAKLGEIDTPQEREFLFPEDEEIKQSLLTAKYTIVSQDKDSAVRGT